VVSRRMRPSGPKRSTPSVAVSRLRLHPAGYTQGMKLWGLAAVYGLWLLNGALVPLLVFGEFVGGLTGFLSSIGIVVLAVIDLALYGWRKGEQRRHPELQPYEPNYNRTPYV
jgi:hypothetical protein